MPRRGRRQSHRLRTPGKPRWAGTFAKAIAAVNALPQQPAFVVHTGDVKHLSKPAQFDAGKRVLSSLEAPLIVLPGEHDVYALDALYAPWGWTTQDGSRVLAALHRFDAVTVLDGHIHQLKVPADALLKVLGYRSVEVVSGAPARVADHSLG